MKLPRPQGPAPSAQAPRSRPQRRQRRRAPTKPTAKDHAVEGAATAIGWLDERTGTTPSCAASSTARCQRARTGSTRSARPRCSPSSRRRSPACSWRCTTSPTPRAYESASHITNEVFLGEFVRGMHKWGSSVMIILIFLHMGRTFFFGAYKYPRERNWVIGVVLLVLTLMMGLTGYLLPFDQRSFWATVVAVNINASGRSSGRSWPTSCAPGRSSGPPRSAASTRSTCCSSRPDRGADRRAPLPRGQARHHGAAVAEGREEDLRPRRSDAPVNAREREYLREYSIQKGQGKPFFPYAVAKDGMMAAITVGVIIFMAILFGPSSAPRPTRPPPPTRRARVVLLLPVRAAARGQAAGAGVPRHDRHPHHLPVLLLMLPFFDRGRSATCCGARSPPPPARHDRRDGLPDGARALAGSPTEIELATSPQYEEGKEITASSGCLGCHKIGENGNTLGRT